MKRINKSNYNKTFLNSKKDFIKISITNNKNFVTEFHIREGVTDTISIGIALASATRVISQAFIQELGMGEEHLDRIQQQIAASYNHDLKLGDLGENESTEGVVE